MKIINTISGTEPLFFHAQGNEHTKQQWFDLINDVIPNTHEGDIIFPDAKDITIITFVHGYMATSFDRQLKKAGINYINLAEYFNHKGVWQNKYKLIYTSQYLNKVTTPYVLISDAIDVLCSSDLSKLLEKFESFKTDILFGASRNCYPREVKVKEPDGICNYLCAGTVIGKTIPMQYFYLELAKKAIEDKNESVNNEQGIVRTERVNFENVRADVNCEIFQSAIHFNYSYENGILTIK